MEVEGREGKGEWDAGPRGPALAKDGLCTALVNAHV